MDRDAVELARFGYAQELLRRLGGFSSFAIGFSVISVLTGVTSTFGDAVASGGPAGLAGLLLAHRSHGAAYLAETGHTTRADGSYALGFVQSLVLGVWTFTGFDAAAHVSEETHDPQRRAPFGIVSSVAVSAVAGFALVAALTLAIPDLSAIAGTSDAALRVFAGALGERVGRFALGLAVLAMWFAGLSSVTSASRMLFAFARDDGLPLAGALRRVSPITRTPLTAIAACVLAALALVAATAPFSDAAFLAVAALATVALYASYAVPIALGAVGRLNGRWTRLGPFSLGRAGPAIAIASVVWTAAVFVICALANALAMGLFAGMGVVLAALWLLTARARFKGPNVDLSHFEEAALHPPGGEAA
jgi:amino acid transporter